MKWRGRRKSTNVNDVRRQSGGGGRRGGGFRLKGGIGGVIIILLISYFTGQNPLNLLINQVETGGGGAVNTQSNNYTPTAAEDELAEFSKVILADTEMVWDKIFKEHNARYTPPKMTLFTGSYPSACGGAESAIGPHYCPADQGIFIDLSFFSEVMAKELGAAGDCAMAYVIAHEVGHHIQNLMGTNKRVNELRRTLSQREYNKVSVAMELQADFYAGVWMRHGQEALNFLEDGDLDEAFNAAVQIGDDTLQKEAGMAIQPDKFNHGTSAQRKKWLMLGYKTGDIRRGDTFSIPYEQL